MTSGQELLTTPGLAGTFVVIAAFNESATIAEVVRELQQRRLRIVVVDDGSTDGTSRCAKSGGADVLRHVVNRGQGAALQSGITYALRHGAKILVTFDADGQHRPEDIDLLVRPILEGRAEIVLGSRFLDRRSRIPVLRRLLLEGAIVFTRLTSGLELTDAHNGLRAFSRRAAKRLEIRQDRMAHASELIDQVRRSGLPWVEVPVEIRYTEHSLSRGQRSSAAFRVLWDYLLGKLVP